ncbi:MAG: glycoside hydrolase family 15 protein [Nitrososphaerota archaeon]
MLESKTTRRFIIPFEGEYKRIEDYGIIGNMRSCALVAYDGSIDWCCLPRFDSPSVFASILDKDKGGRWQITSIDRCYSEQRYRENTNILETTFFSEDFKVKLIDFMPCRKRGIWSAPPEIHRHVVCEKGKARMKMSIMPMFEYGLQKPRLIPTKNGAVFLSRSHEMILSTEYNTFKPGDGSLYLDFSLSEGESRTFVLSYGESIPRDIDDYRSERWLKVTEKFWTDWVASLSYKGRWKDAVIRSALTLQLLVYSATGAMVAAPTTSLPEQIGGSRNWDYRYSWIRDSAYSLWAFKLIGSRSQAEDYLHWLIDNNPALDLELQPLYTIDGRKETPERELTHMAGYKNSKPVRIGNAASRQLQMDAHGSILDALYFSSKHGTGVSDEMYFRFVRPLAYYIRNNWRKPGNGIWEMRGKKRHFVYTKVWCYVGLDRATKIAKMKGQDDDAKVWIKEMKKIKSEVLRKGWSSAKEYFKMDYDSESLDSANLLIPLLGFLSPNDSRVIKTVDAIKKELSEEGLLKRYSAEDSLPGKEGAFILSNFWLVASLARIGRKKEAEKIFERLLGMSNHLGLYSEEIDPSSKSMLGNFPQAFSHMGVIMAANELSR